VAVRHIASAGFGWIRWRFWCLSSFSIGVSHGVQQINYIVREIRHGKARRRGTRQLLGFAGAGTLAG